jgi:glycine cleavage system H lipoate-binding protein
MASMVRGLLLRRPGAAAAVGLSCVMARRYAAKYTASHEWINVGANGVGTVGITDYAQGMLGDIVFIGLPAVGKKAALKGT